MCRYPILERLTRDRYSSKFRGSFVCDEIVNFIYSEESGMSSVREEWPELVGKSVTEAATAIEVQNCGLHVHILESHSCCTDDEVENRLRYF